MSQVSGEFYFRMVMCNEILVVVRSGENARPKNHIRPNASTTIRVFPPARDEMLTCCMSFSSWFVLMVLLLVMCCVRMDVVDQFWEGFYGGEDLEVLPNIYSSSS